MQLKFQKKSHAQNDSDPEPARKDRTQNDTINACVRAYIVLYYTYRCFMYNNERLALWSRMSEETGAELLFIPALGLA